MNMSKKIGLMFLPILFFTACSIEEALSEEDITIRMMYWGGAEERVALQDITRSFEEDNPHINVDLQHVPGDYPTKINILMAGNDLPDIAYLSEELTMRWAEQGWMLNMADYFDEYPELRDNLPQAYNWYEEGQTAGAHNHLQNMTVYYDRDIFDELDIPYPPIEADEAWDWDQFVETAKMLTIDGNGNNALSEEFNESDIIQYGISLGKNYTVWYPLLRSNGADIADEDGYEYAMNSPEAIEVFQSIQDLVYEHRVAPLPAQQETLGAAHIALQTGRVAMAIDGNWGLFSFQDSDINLGMTNFPYFEEPTNLMFGAPIVLFETTEYPEETLEYFMYLSNIDEIDLFSDGLWGAAQESYYTDEERLDSWTSAEHIPEEYSEVVAKYAYENPVKAPHFVYRNLTEILQVIDPQLDRIWLNMASAEEVLNDLEEEVQPLLDGKYPEDDPVLYE